MVACQSYIKLYPHMLQLMWPCFWALFQLFHGIAGNDMQTIKLFEKKLWKTNESSDDKYYYSAAAAKHLDVESQKFSLTNVLSHPLPTPSQQVSSLWVVVKTSKKPTWRAFFKTSSIEKGISLTSDQLENPLLDCAIFNFHPEGTLCTLYIFR